MDTEKKGQKDGKDTKTRYLSQFFSLIQDNIFRKEKP